MTTFKPRPPYTDEELRKLYPRDLELQLVQVLMRHGERTPVSARFEAVGLHPHWPYCSAAERLRSAVLTPNAANGWTEMQWKRRLETFGNDDRPVPIRGQHSQTEGICQLGELTDLGRQTTHDLGTRLRRLYIDQLQFLPTTLENTDQFYLRSTPVPRALESLQEAFTGLYPPSTLSADFAPPHIITRSFADETLFPNDGACKRYRQLAQAFGRRTAEHFNNSPEMDFLNKKLSKYMPETSPKVAVDGHPRLSGILDTTNSTLAHGPSTKLPKEFYEQKVLDTVNDIVVEEWFAGFRENREYRTLGSGPVAGDIVERMTNMVDESKSLITKPEDKRIKFALSGCHDTTLAALLITLGGFQGEKWPPYTSHVAVELFKAKKPKDVERSQPDKLSSSDSRSLQNTNKPGWLASMLGVFSGGSTTVSESTQIGRKPFTQLSAEQQASLQDYYVRVRYNDQPVTLTACRIPGNHLEGDESFCTLETFKRVVDSITPQDWRKECRMNLDQPVVGVDGEVGGSSDIKQPAGRIEGGF